MKIKSVKRIKDRIGINFVNIILTAAVALATLLAIYFLLLASPPAIAMDDHPLVGKTMPEFELYDYARNAHTLEKFRGKSVLIVFWWPGDTNCEQALKIFKTVDEKYSNDDLQVIAIDLKAETSKALLQITKMELDYLCLEGIYKEHIRDYHLSGVPSIFLIDKDGIVKLFLAGLEDISSLYSFIDKMLPEKP